ncbi:Uncharacterised protein [Serratia fonticola]|uniref:Uncharacterized protein n=1 Tax=Serratia fonticola TaxID=47917 RepID=A0A4U9TA39_SERFO|nr:Uncharacterised protein [Serratia fonticola]
MLFNKRLIVQVLLNHHMSECVDQGDVGTVFQRQMDIRNTRRFDIARIANNDLGSFLLRLENAAGDNRMRVRAL